MVHFNSYYHRHLNERLEYQRLYRDRIKQDDDMDDMNVVENDCMNLMGSHSKTSSKKVKVPYVKKHLAVPYLMTFY